jgi:hypothetical protein
MREIYRDNSDPIAFHANLQKSAEVRLPGISFHYKFNTLLSGVKIPFVLPDNEPLPEGAVDVELFNEGDAHGPPYQGNDGKMHESYHTHDKPRAFEDYMPVNQRLVR